MTISAAASYFCEFCRVRIVSTSRVAQRQGVYAGFIGETGNAWAADESPSLDDLHRSLTLIVGADTVIGPVFLGYARADGPNQRFYVTIGKTF
jgi:outer membrane translocation and assembly module TamA